jgi:MOSC domain-containing protein YiiM
MTGRIVSVNTSERTGIQKQPQPQVELAVEHGIRGDAHAGDWHRQVSLLAIESIQKMRDCGADVGPGAFGENVTTEGVVVYELPVGTRLRLGDSLCEVTQIGKVCHDRCAIFHQVGDCVMPREGIFVRVLQGGTLQAGDAIEVLADAPAAQADAAAGAGSTAGTEADHV